MHFTLVSLLAWIAGFFFKGRIQSVASLLLLHTWVTFHMAPLYDSSCYERLRRKTGWTKTVFHAGDLLLHTIPLAISFATTNDYQVYDIFYSITVYTSWCAYQGTINHETNYVIMPVEFWFHAVNVSIVAQCITVFFFRTFV